MIAPWCGLGPERILLYQKQGRLDRIWGSGKNGKVSRLSIRNTFNKPSSNVDFQSSVGHVFGSSSAQLLPLCSFVLHFANIRGLDGGKAPSWGIRGMFEIYPVLKMPMSSRGIPAYKTCSTSVWCTDGLLGQEIHKQRYRTEEVQGTWATCIGTKLRRVWGINGGGL